MTVLEDAFEELLASAFVAAFRKSPSAEWLLGMSMRAGLRGSVATLEQAGAVVGVTRQRVSQVMEKVEPLLKGAEVPHLREAVQLLIERSPVEEPIGHTLSDAGLARETLTGAGLLNMLKLIGSSPRDIAGRDLVRVDEWLVEESEVPIMRSMFMAKKHTSSFGLTTVEEILRAIATPDYDLDAQDVVRVLQASPSVNWAGDWLWVDKEADNPRSSRLVNTARAILAVNSPQTVASIHEGARRMWRFRRLEVLPPAAAMKTFFRQSPYFVVDGDLVSPIEPLDYHEILGDVTGAMIDVLKSSELGVMDRQSLEEACRDAGIARGTYGVWTTYAEWMERFAPNVWGLRGSNPHPAAVETVRSAARTRSRSEPHRRVWAWSEGGLAVHTMDVTTSLLSTGVLSFETALHNLIAGQAIALLSRGRQIATAKLSANHQFCWGWHPALKALGAKKGDVLQIRLDIASRKADLRIGGQELWGDA